MYELLFSRVTLETDDHFLLSISGGTLAVEYVHILEGSGGIDLLQQEVIRLFTTTLL